MKVTKEDAAKLASVLTGCALEFDDSYIYGGVVISCGSEAVTLWSDGSQRFINPGRRNDRKTKVALPSGRGWRDEAVYRVSRNFGPQALERGAR